jgi:hypothetical protein
MAGAPDAHPVQPAALFRDCPIACCDRLIVSHAVASVGGAVLVVCPLGLAGAELGGGEPLAEGAELGGAAARLPALVVGIYLIMRCGRTPLFAVGV